jgi:hypothetical protein
MVAEKVLGTEFTVAAKDVSAEYREHCMLTNELFVRLALPALEKVRMSALPFGWNPAETTRLPWVQYNAASGRRQDKLVVPDAVLELPDAKRRVFVECETGTQPIVASDRRPGATVMKVAAYEAFVRKYADVDKRQTFYLKAYPDGWAPEVLFLVMSDGRKASVNQALRDTARKCATGIRARALTHDEAVRDLGLQIPSPRNGLPVVKGRRKFTPEDGEALRSFFNSAVGALGTASTLLKRYAPEAELRDLERSREETKALAKHVHGLLIEIISDHPHQAGAD